MNAQEQLWGTNPTKKELLAGVNLFIVPVIGYLLAAIPNQIISPKFGYALLGILALGLLYGAWQGFPAWSLPYLGCFVSIFALLKSTQYLGELLSPHILNLIGPRPWSMIDRLALQFLWNGITWVFLFILTILLVILLALIPRFRTLLVHIVQDWTALSFILYGGTILSLVILFEEYRDKESLLISSLLILAAGAYFYLHGGTQRRKILSMLAAVTLAMLITAAGKWVILPYQDWGPYLEKYPVETERWFEALSALITWGWMLLIILAPAVLGWFNRDRSSHRLEVNEGVDLP